MVFPVTKELINLKMTVAIFRRKHYQGVNKNFDISEADVKVFVK